MEIAKIAVKETTGVVVLRKRIPAGIVGATVSVLFDSPVWGPLQKVVTFRVGDETLNAEFDGSNAVIPHECTKEPGKVLFFGIWGHDPETGLQLPLIEVRIGQIENATDPNATPATDPTLPIWAQLQAEIYQLKQSGVSEEKIAQVVNDYLAKNPPSVTETDPTVPSWAKQPEKPSYTADEVGSLSKDALGEAINDALAQAKESGEFDGKDGYTPVKGKDYFDGEPGKDYVLTDADKAEIAEMASELVDVPDSGGNEELHDIRTGYNQITYPNAGDAVRGQNKQLANFMQAMASMDSDLLDLSGAVFDNGKYVNEDGTVSVHGSLKYTQDHINIEPDWESFTVLKIVYGITNGTETTIGVPIVIFYTSSGVAGGISSENITHDGDLVTYKIPHWATSARINFGTTNPIDIVRVNKFKNGKVGAFAGTFTEYKQKLFTGIYLRKNQTYLIRKENVADPFNVFLENDSSPFVRMRKHTHEKYFTPDSAGQLVLYNEANFGHLGEVNVSVYRAEDERLLIEKQPKVYTIGDREQEYDYTSFTQCLIDLKDDKSTKIIYINEGDYNIYQEYKDAGVPVYTGDSPTYDYPEYCVWIPDNTHIIGRGIVRLMWMPDPNEVDLTYNESVTVSPVNCAGTMTLENVEIHCKNGRYCIHDDVLGNGEFTNAIKKYINVRCYKYANDTGFGFNATIGFGVDRTMRYEFHNCLFKNEGTGAAFYMHDRKTVGGTNLTAEMGSNLIVSNCVMDASGATCVKFGNSASAAHIRVDFNSCWFSGRIDCINESSSAETVYPNSWDLKLCLCNQVEINIADTGNLYPPAVYSNG